MNYRTASGAVSYRTDCGLAVVQPSTNFAAEFFCAVSLPNKRIPQRAKRCAPKGTWLFATRASRCYSEAKLVLGLLSASRIHPRRKRRGILRADNKEPRICLFTFSCGYGMV